MRHARLSVILLAALFLFSAVQAETPAVGTRDELREALLSHREEISLSRALSREEFRLAYSHLLATDPDLFFVASDYTCVAEGEYVTRVGFSYRFDEAETRRAAADFDTRVGEIASLASGIADERERVAVLHDAIIRNFSYDTRGEIFDAYSMLLYGRGVCQAYALLFCAAARRAGLACEVVTCFPKNHSWNEVRVGGVFRHVDLVWDTDGAGGVTRDIFLLTDRELRAARASDPAFRDAYSWDAPFPCI